MKLDRYKENLRIHGDFVYSFDTKVARVVNRKLLVLKQYAKYSASTTRHIGYVCREFNLEKEVVDTFSF